MLKRGEYIAGGSVVRTLATAAPSKQFERLAHAQVGALVMMVLILRR